MKKLMTFILGMVTAKTIIPILDSFTEIVLGNLEVFKGKATKRVLTVNKEINEMEAELEPVNTQAIGFAIPDTNEELVYEEEEENKKSKIGFIR